MVAWQAIFYTPATAAGKQAEDRIDKSTKQAAIEALMEIPYFPEFILKPA